MKPQHPLLRAFTSGWKIVVLLTLPIFIAAMWYGISQHYEDIWLYAVAMLLASWGVAGWAVNVVRKWQEWRRMKNQGGRDASHLLSPDGQQKKAIRYGKIYLSVCATSERELRLNFSWQLGGWSSG